MPLGEHLEELRKRLVYALYGLVPIAIVALAFGKQLLNFLLRPLFLSLDRAGNGSAQATGPLETFGAYIKVSLIAALIVGGPWLLWQLWRFVAPGLFDREKRFIYVLLPLSVVLTTIGVTFLYQVVMPLMLAFFLQFGADIGVRTATSAPLPANIALPTVAVLANDPPASELRPGMYWLNTSLHQLRFCTAINDNAPVIYCQTLGKDSSIRQDYRITEYIGLLLSLMLAFAVSFQTPVIVLLLGWAGIVNTEFLSKYRKYALFATSIVAALLTPGDVASMIMLWIPLYLLYELGGLLLRILPARRVAGIKPENPDAAV